MLLIYLSVGLWAIPVWDQDEGAYAGFALNMFQGGDWVIPDFMWSFEHRKTPLHFWLIACCYKAFGVNEWAVRFPAWIYIWSTLILVFFQVRRFFDEKTAKYAVLILSGSFLIPFLTRMSLTDSGIVFYGTLAGFSMLNVIEGRGRIWVLWFWIAIACSLLTKGPAVILSVGLLFLILFFFKSYHRQLFGLHPWFYGLLALLPFGLWIFMTFKTDDGTFARWLYAWYIQKRVDGTRYAQGGPPGLHLLMLTAIFIPFLYWVLSLFKQSIHILKGKGSVSFFLFLWFLCSWVPYEFSQSKLPTYIIMTHVPFAVLLAVEAAKRNSKESVHKNFKIIHLILNILLGVALVSLPFYFFSGKSFGILISILGVLYIIGFLMQYVRFNIVNLLLVPIVFQVSAYLVLPVLTRETNVTQRVANYVQNTCKKQTPILIANDRFKPPSLPFYLRRNFENVQEERNMDTLKTRLRANKNLCLILDSLQYQQMMPDIKQYTLRRMRSYAVDRGIDLTYFICIKQQPE